VGCGGALGDRLCSETALSIMFFTACHALALLFSRSIRDICKALRARCRSGASKRGLRSSDRICMMAWKDAIPPLRVSFSSCSVCRDYEPICHWKRAASTSAAAPFSVSTQFTDFSKILILSAIVDSLVKTFNATYERRISSEKTMSR
jgi:hypothetical protein